MDHVVYVDHRAKELSKMASGTKRMIIRGAAGRKMPYDRVFTGDCLYLIENDGSGRVRAKAVVSSVLNSDQLNREESNQLIEDHQGDLQLTGQQFKRWAGKRYLVLIGFKDFQLLEPFEIDRSGYGNMDDWLPVEEIGRVMK